MEKEALFFLLFLICSLFVINFLVVSPSEGSGRGGGSAGGYPVYDIDQTQLDNGYSTNLSDNWGFSIMINNETRSLVLNEVSNDSAVFILSGNNAQIINISEGMSKDIDVNGDGSDDITISLDSISGSQAGVTVKSIDGTGSGQNATQNKSAGVPSDLIILVVVFLAILLYYFFLKKIRRQHLRNIFEARHFRKYRVI